MPAAAGRALLGVDLVFVFSSFTFSSLALNHLPRLASAAGLLYAALIFVQGKTHSFASLPCKWVCFFTSFCYCGL